MKIKKYIGLSSILMFTLASEEVQSQSNYYGDGNINDEISYISKKASRVLVKKEKRETEDMNKFVEELITEIINNSSNNCNCIKKAEWIPLDKKIKKAEWIINNISKLNNETVLRFSKIYDKKNAEFITIKKHENEWVLIVTIMSPPSIDYPDKEFYTEKIYNQYSLEIDKYLKDLRILFKDYKLSTDQDYSILSKISAKF